MSKQKSLQSSFLIFLSACAPLFTGCKSFTQSNLVTKVYIAEGKPGIILFDTESKKSQVLIQDTFSVFAVMQTSLSREWAVVSKMPADPDEARGSGEEKLLFHIPRKRIVYHPGFGNRAYLIAIEMKGTTEEVQWMHSDEVISMPLTELRKTCLDTPGACADSAGSQEQQDGTVDSNQKESPQNEEPVVVDGWLTLSLPQDGIIAHIGEPDSKNEDQYWGATGTYVQEWKYKKQGLRLNMESDTLNGLKKVRSILLDPSSNLTIQDGVGIGTFYNAIKTMYTGKIDTKSSNENLIVIGSVYGGILLHFKNNKVSTIFIGAAAE